MTEEFESDREATRKLAHAIVAAALTDEEPPLDIDIHSDDPIALVQFDDAAALALKLAKEIVSLQNDELTKYDRIGDFLVRQQGKVTIDVNELRRIYAMGIEYGVVHGAVAITGKMTITAQGMKVLEQASRIALGDRVKAAIKGSLPWLERDSHNFDIDATTEAVVDAVESAGRVANAPEKKELRDRLFRVLADTALATWDDEHLLDRLVAAARGESAPAPEVPRHLPIGMAHSLDAAEVKALRALRLAGIDLVARDALERDPHSRLMFARVRGSTNVGADTVKVGELACVEVPANCSIHDADAQRMIQTLALADMIGRHWRDQEGVNVDLIDQLAAVTDTSFVTNTIKEG